MGWDDAPPTQTELKSAAFTAKTLNWAAAPPSQEELQKHADTQNPGILDKIGDAAKSFGKAALDDVAYVADAVNRYTGPPTRAGVDAALSGKNPITAFVNQMGAPADQAPTAHDVLVKGGVSDVGNKRTVEEQMNYDKNRYPDVYEMRTAPGSKWPYKEEQYKSPAELLQLPAEFAMDWTNAIPAYGLAKKLTGVGVGEVAKFAGSSVAKGAAAIGKAATEAVPVVGKSVAAGVEDTAKATTQFFGEFFNPKYAGDRAALLETAKKNGIDVANLPASVSFGETSIPSRIERNIREGTAGAPEIEQWNKANKQLQTAIDGQVEKISGGKPPVTETTAGLTIRDGFKQAVDRLFQIADTTHNKVIDMFPGLKIDGESWDKIQSKLTGIKNEAIRLTERGIDDADVAQGRYLLNAIKNFNNSNGSYKQAYEALTSIGRKAFGTSVQGQIPHDVKKMQELYFTLRDAMVDTVRFQKGDAIADALQQSNALIADFNKDASFVRDIIESEKTAPENVFKKLLLNGDSQKINVLKGMLTPEQFSQMKGAFLDSLAKSGTDGNYSVRQLYSALQNKRPVVEALFKPEEIGELGDLLKLGDRFGKFSLSSSETGGSNIFSRGIEGIKSGVTNRSTLNRMKEQAAAAESASKSGTEAVDDSVKVSKINAGSKVSQNIANSEKLVGEAKWADSGRKNLENHSSDSAQLLKQNEDFLNSPAGKRLLIQASDLKPGSKAMENILQKLKSRK